MKFATANGKNRVCVVGILGYCMCFAMVGVLFSALTAV